MRVLPVKIVAIIVLSSILHNRSSSQQLTTDTSSPPAYINAVAFYNNSFAPQLHLFNGKEYRDYRKPFTEGQPYFITNNWNKGTISYYGNTYDDVSLIYNLVTDQVIILNYSNISKIQLIKEKVSGFSVSGHSFINIPPDSLLSSDLTPGFYDLLAAGKISLLVRRTKNIKTYTKQSVEVKVYSKDYYYVKKNNSYSSVNGKKAFFEQFNDRKKEIEQFTRQNRLRYRKDPENTMVRVVEYYNQITK